MNPERLKKILTQVKQGKLTVDGALKSLKHLPFEDIDFARIDHHRSPRKGFPEVIFGEGKTDRPDHGNHGPDEKRTTWSPGWMPKRRPRSASDIYILPEAAYRPLSRIMICLPGR